MIRMWISYRWCHMSIYEFVGEQIRSLRESRRMSQDALAKAVGVSTNTISRWETAAYKPSVEDLQKVARYFSVKLSALLPAEEGQEEPAHIQALLSATGDLHPDDVEELIDFAEVRRARRRLGEKKK